MKRNHAPEAEPEVDAVQSTSTPAQRVSVAEPAAERWQALQGSIGNAAFGRLLGGEPAAPAAPALREPQSGAYVQRAPGDEDPLSLQTAQTDTASLDTDVASGGAGEAEEMSGGKRRTKDEAIAMVDKHVEPKECFVWYENNKTGWAPMPGTGCAHWVAHEYGYTDGLKCDKGYTVRVRNITAGRAKVEMKDVVAGDLWENPSDASHIGIIRSVNSENGRVASVEVEHDSVRSGGVVKSTFTEGLFYKGGS